MKCTNIRLPSYHVQQCIKMKCTNHITLHSLGAQTPTRQLRLYNSTTQLPHNNRIVPRGTTVLLECRVTPHQQQIHYQWTCPHPPCDREYRKVYNNLILIVATDTTSGRYKCTPNPHENEVSVSLTVQTSLPEGKWNMFTVYHIKALYHNICPLPPTTRYSCSLPQK